MSIETRRELAKLRHLAAQLAARSVTVQDEPTSDLAQKIYETTAALVTEAEQAGPLPAVSRQAAGLEVPLHLLDTPANRRYLAALEAAYEAALAVDRERGYGEDGPAQQLANMVAETRQEVNGPKGLQE